MSNDYFVHSANRIPAGTLARVSQVNAIGDEIELGFDKLPSQVNLTQGTTPYVVDTGIADAYVVTFVAPLVPSGYVEAMIISMRPANDCTAGGCTIDANGLGAIALKTADGSALPAKAIKKDEPIDIRYDAVASEARLVRKIITVKNASGVEVVVGS